MESQEVMRQPTQSSNGTSHKLPLFDHVDPLNPFSKLPQDDPILDCLRQPALEADETVKMFHLLGQCLTVVGYDKPPRPDLLRELQEMINYRIAEAAGVEPPENAAYLSPNDPRSLAQKRKRRHETANSTQSDIDSDLESLNVHEWQIPQGAQYNSPQPPPSQHLYRVQSSTFSHSTNSYFVPPKIQASSINPFQQHPDYQTQIYGWFLVILAIL